VKSSLVISAYFGKLPYYFPLWRKTAKFNRDINWLVFTDKIASKIDGNIQYVFTSLKEIEEIASDKLKSKIKLSRPYKICDLRPSFPLIFQEYIKDYEYWGHCDIDVIWGNFKKFLNHDYIWDSDIITADRRRVCGPFTLFKNEEKTNTLYKNIDNYIEKVNSSHPSILDEMEFSEIKEEGRSKEFINKNNFKIFRGHEFEDQIICLQRYSSNRVPAYWNNGSLFIEKYFRNLVVEGNDFFGFGSQTMLLHVRPWLYVDLDKNSIHHKDETKEINKNWRFFDSQKL
jgi:hypothetical protein